MAELSDIYVLDKEFNTVAVLDAYSSFIWTDRYDQAGDFEIATQVSLEMLDALQKDYYIIRRDSDHVMTIDTIQVSSDPDYGQQLIISGYSLEMILDRRIIWKQTQLSGNLQTAVQKILNENAISPSDSSRKIPELHFKESTDSEITGLTIEAQFTGDSLYDAVCDICMAYDLGFQITMPEPGYFEFMLYKGVDRTYDQSERPYIIFSPNFENLMNSSYIESDMNYKTVALVAGEGEGSERKYISVTQTGGAKTGLERREVFVDARDVQSSVDGKELTTEEYNQTLTSRGQEQLAGFYTTITFDGEAETSRSFKYQQDYFIGDLVQLENEYGMTFVARITEYIWSHDSNGIKEYPSYSIID